MSGGALDYLCHNGCISTNDLGYIEMAIERLERIPECIGTKAHQDLLSLRDSLKNVQSKYEKLNAVLHDIEWVMSGDYGEDTLIETVKNANSPVNTNA